MFRSNILLHEYFLLLLLLFIDSINQSYTIICMCSDFLTSRDLIRSRKKPVCHHSFSYIKVRSVANFIGDLKRKRNQEKERQPIHIDVCLLPS